MLRNPRRGWGSKAWNKAGKGYDAGGVFQIVQRFTSQISGRCARSLGALRLKSFPTLQLVELSNGWFNAKKYDTKLWTHGQPIWLASILCACLVNLLRCAVTMTELPHKRLLQIWKSPLIMMDCRARCHHPRRQQKIRRLVHLAGQVVPEHSSAAKDPGLFLSPSIFGSSCSDPFMIKPTISKRKLRLCFLFSANGCPSNLFRKKASSWLLQILRLPGCLQPGKSRKRKARSKKK